MGTTRSTLLTIPGPPHFPPPENPRLLIFQITGDPGPALCERRLAWQKTRSAGRGSRITLGTVHLPRQSLCFSLASATAYLVPCLLLFPGSAGLPPTPGRETSSLVQRRTQIVWWRDPIRPLLLRHLITFAWGLVVPQQKKPYPTRRRRGRCKGHAAVAGPSWNGSYLTVPG